MSARVCLHGKLAHEFENFLSARPDSERAEDFLRHVLISNEFERFRFNDALVIRRRGDSSPGEFPRRTDLYGFGEKI